MALSSISTLSTWTYLALHWLSILGQGRYLDDVLHHGSPGSAGMDPGALHRMVGNLTAYTRSANYSKFSYYEIHPIEPGGTVIVGHKNTIVSAFAFGKKNLYVNAAGDVLPKGQQEDASLGTIYDTASLTKLFTTVAVLRQIDAGRINLNGTVETYIPGFQVNGKANITILMLLTHTSGFDSGPRPPLYSSFYHTYEQRIKAIITQGLRSTPGSTFLYSDLSFMTLGIVLEKVTGRTLDDLVAEFTAQLGMRTTFFNRNNIEGPCNPLYCQTAPTEFQIQVMGSSEPARPQPVRGTVHDENSWSLNGVAGHAGLFSTAKDCAIFCQMILNNGTYGGHQILSPDAVDLIFTNFNARFHNIDYDHGAGFELNQQYTAGPLNNSLVASHTGFTGTSIVIDRGRNLFYVHLANRIHPTRNWSSNNIVRQALGYWVGSSLGLDLKFPNSS